MAAGFGKDIVPETQNKREQEEMAERRGSLEAFKAVPQVVGTARLEPVARPPGTLEEHAQLRRSRRPGWLEEHDGLRSMMA